MDILEVVEKYKEICRKHGDFDAKGISFEDARIAALSELDALHKKSGLDDDEWYGVSISAATDLLIETLKVLKSI